MKKLSLLLSIMIMFTFLSPSVYAYKNDYKIISQEYKDPDKNKGVYLIEDLEIDGELYRFTHSLINDIRTIEMSGAETGIFSAPINGNGELKDISYKTRSSDWYEMSEKEDTFHAYIDIGRAALAAGIAALVGGPVAAFLSAASVIIAFLAGKADNLTVFTGGRWKIEGTHIRFEMYSKYYSSDGTYIKTTYWNGTR